MHPLFVDKKSYLYYTGLWFVVFAIHVWGLSVLTDFSVRTVFLESFVSIFLFALLGLSLYYITYGTKFDKFNLFDFLVRHLVYLILLLILWIFIGELVLQASEPSVSDNTIKYMRGLKGFEGSMLYIVIVSSFYLIDYYRDNKKKTRTEVELRKNLKETELKVIKSQINPHFLFNSLNSISSLTITNPEVARNTIISLSEYLRYSLKKTPNDLVELQVEINNVKRYLEIEKVRFGNRMDVTFDITPDCKTCLVPVLILQPLYENAIKHGVYESSQTIKIETFIRIKDTHLKIEILNGIDIDSVSRKGEGIGLKSVSDRLQLLYGVSDKLKTYRRDNQFIVELKIPLSYGN